MRQVPIASETQIRAMEAKLAQRSNGSVAQRSEQAPVEREVAGSIPAGAAKPKLQWNKTQRDSMAVKTVCGRYSCCKIITNGKLHYELWKLVTSGEWFIRIDKGSGLDNFLQAQVMAQQDADK